MTQIAQFPIAEVIHSGISTTLQDLGRPDAKKFGVPLGGVMDRTSAQQANLLFENPATAAVYEILGGIKLRCLRETWFCLTGAGTAHIDHRPIPFHRTLRWKKGEVLSIQANAYGLWTYLAIPGGWYGETYLGSRSVWPQAGMGRKLRMGDQLFSHSSEEYVLPRCVAARSTPRNQIPLFPEKNQITSIRAWSGPQASAFSEEIRSRFWQESWTISLNSSRAGYRLEGPILCSPEATMASEPIVLGSIQVPPNGQPIILLNDGPTIGGYPKIALLHSLDMDALRQQPPLSRITFVRCD